MPPRGALLFVASALLLMSSACGDDGSSNQPSGAGGASSADGSTASSGSGPAASSDAGTPDPGSPHTPATGCHDGYVACGDVCAHVEDDSRHCGGCDLPCMATEGCVGSMCVEDQGCPYGGILCGGACATPSTNADHCGSCDDRCADDAVCVHGACKDGGGDGTSCTSPLFWDVAADESAGFRMSAALSTTHVFSCGPLEPIQTRWFRFTATKDGADTEIKSTGADDYVIELYDGTACDTPQSMACNDEANAPDPELKDPPTLADTTYFLAVGIKGPASGEPAVIRVDH